MDGDSSTCSTSAKSELNPLQKRQADFGPVDSQLDFAEEMQQENLEATTSAHEEFASEEVAEFIIDSPMGEIDLRNMQEVIENEDLVELKKVGSGSFGTVYHGKWRDVDVAIKRITRSCFRGRSLDETRMILESTWEAGLLSKLHHENVVKFYGVAVDEARGTLAIVTEFMVNGSLRNILSRKDEYLDSSKQQLLIAIDAAAGMEYLHRENIVHFDLKCDNLLVDLKDPSRPICKIADFGLSKIKRETLISGGMRGTIPWMAPELLNGSYKVSEKVDVFSFGIVMWEILTGEEPYANMKSAAIIDGVLKDTLRPLLPASCPLNWGSLMKQCWASDPQQRPSFTHIANRLRTMTVTSPTEKKVIIKNEDLVELKELGSGTFGMVFLGTWIGIEVAIKRIRKSCFTGRSSKKERLILESLQEAKRLDGLHHPNIVCCYAVVQEKSQYNLAIVMEFMVNGSLRNALLRKDKQLSHHERLTIAMDVASGMEYLHLKNIVHFDLKCDNLFVDLRDPSRPICKVGDFGLSSIRRNILVSGAIRRKIPWMAPELLNGNSDMVSEKVDVFSFGIVMWEILTGDEPYADMSDAAIISGIWTNTLRPPVPRLCDPEWRILMEQCWASNPQQRPPVTWHACGRLGKRAVAIPLREEVKRNIITAMLSSATSKLGEKMF